MAQALATPRRVRKNRHRWRKTASGRQHYNYFRDYEPGTGRYVQSDPIGQAGGPSTYAYASGSPLTRVDRLGLLDIFIGGANDDSLKHVSDYRAAFQAETGRRTAYFEWWQSSDAYDAIVAALIADPCEKINVVGHSLGASAAWRLSQRFGPGAIDLLITVDPVGALPRAPNLATPAQTWININADAPKYNWRGDLVATIGTKWGDLPASYADRHIRAPYSHEYFRKLIEHGRDGSGAADALRSQAQGYCGCGR